MFNSIYLFTPNDLNYILRNIVPYATSIDYRESMYEQHTKPLHNNIFYNNSKTIGNVLPTFMVLYIAILLVAAAGSLIKVMSGLHRQ